MIEVYFPDKVLSFDGRVVEVFYSRIGQGSRRYHIAHLVSAEVVTGRRKTELNIRFPQAIILDTVSVESMTEVEQFVAALLSAQGAR